MNTQQKGHIAQLKVELRALEKGFAVSRPSVDARYDLVVDNGESLLRVQVKYCDANTTHSVGSFFVGLRRWAGDRRDVSRNYRADEIDALAVYLPSTEKVYWIPVQVIDDKSSLTLRTEAPRNGQTKGIRMASDFEW